MSRKIPGKDPYRPNTHKRCKICLSPYREEIESMWVMNRSYAEICAEFSQLNLRPNNISRHMIFSGLKANPEFKAKHICEEVIRKGLHALDSREISVRDMIAAARALSQLEHR